MIEAPLPPLFTRARLRLLGAFLGIVTLILIVFCLGVGAFVRTSLLGRFDSQLVAYAHAALASIDIEAGRFDLRSSPPSSSSSTPADTELQWFGPEGQLLRQLGTLQGLEPLGEPPATGRFEVLGGGHLRTWTEPVRSGGVLVGYLRVTRTLTAIEEPFAQLAWGLAWGVPVALAAAALGGWWLTGWIIRPVADNFLRLEQFTADASHELRNPLMAIQVNCGVALRHSEGMRPGDREKFLRIEDGASQLLGLVQDLLTLARTQPINDSKDPQDGSPHQTVDLAALVDELHEEFAPIARDRQIAFEVDYSQVVGWWVRGKRTQLRCLVANLIENALKFTPEGGRVRVDLDHRPPSAVVVAVSDTGVGIAPEDLPHIFDRFWQADRSRHRRDGTGLGLAIARGIASAHGGSLQAESVLGKGSVFRVRLEGERGSDSQPPQDDE